MDRTRTPTDHAPWLAGLRRDGRSLVRSLAARMPYRPAPFGQGQLIALACTAGGAGLRFVLDPIVQGHVPVMVFYPFVLLASIWGGSFAGLSVLVLGGLVADLFWLPTEGRTITLTAFAIICLFGIALARLLRTMVELHVEGEERAILLAHEVNHRANNLLGVVQSISMQTARNATSIAEHQSVFTGRLSALARAQQLVSANPQAPPDLREFLLHIIEPFGAERFRLDGPVSKAPHHLLQACALLLHELSTNATKYGALSTPEGRVEISWEQKADRVSLHWRERDGPRVTPPTRAGFGSRLLRTAFPPEHGEASVVFDPDGVRCTVHFVAA